MNSSYFTGYKIENPGERSCLITYLLIVLLSSLTGDSIILIVSVKYNALKLNKAIVAVLQHIAACNLLQTISLILPTMISLIANRWILGETTGYILFLINAVSSPVSSILVCILNIVKLMLLQRPLSLGIIMATRRNVHVCCGAVWVLAMVFPGLHLILDTNKFLFDYIRYNIVVTPSSDLAMKISQAIIVISFIIPAFIVTVSTVFILRHLKESRKAAKRSGGTLRWQGVLTVLATALVYCFSIVPFSISYLRLLFHIRKISGKREVSFARISHFLPTLNIMSNFYIYCLTVSSFRKFILSKALVLSERFSLHLRLVANNCSRSEKGANFSLSSGDETHRSASL